MASPIEQFEIKPLLPINIGGIDLSITNQTVWLAVTVALVVWVFSAAIRAPRLVPGRTQNFVEAVYGFVFKIADDNIGPQARQFFPFILTLFLVVALANVLGMVPYSFTVTSHLAVTLSLALTVFAIVLIQGFGRHGLGFLRTFLPPGVPALIAPLLIVIELISFLSRPLTLAMRLFLNMMAGHIILKVFGSLVPKFGVLGVIPFAVTTALVGLEFAVAILQAYVFTLLACLYIHDAVEMHH